MKSSRVLRCFLNADLRLGHPGLTALAKKEGRISTSDLAPGDYLVFINSHRNKIKIYGASEVVAYHRMGKGDVIDPRVIARIPQAFLGASKFEYDSILREVIEESLAKKKQKLSVEEVGRRARHIA
jgi:hypothetical protein